MTAGEALVRAEPSSDSSSSDDSEVDRLLDAHVIGVLFCTCERRATMRAMQMKIDTLQMKKTSCHHLVVPSHLISTCCWKFPTFCAMMWEEILLEG